MRSKTLQQKTPNKETSPPAEVKMQFDIWLLLEKIKWPVFALYSGLVLLGAFNHEAWSDEAQAWLIARDNSIPGILKLLPTEGHPPLWYFILFPFAQSGMSFEFIRLLPAIISIAAVYPVMFRTRLHIALKLCLPLSYAMFYEYALFVRSYSLIIFFIACITALYPRRFEKPWLFALCVIGLFNTHVLIFGLAAGIVGLYALDAFHAKRLKGQVMGAFIFMCIGGFYLLPYLAATEMTGHFANNISEPGKHFRSVIRGGILIEGDFHVSLAIFITLLALLIQRPKALLLAISGSAVVIYILLFGYMGQMRHFVALFCAVFGSYAIAAHYEEDIWTQRINIKRGLIQWGTFLLCGAIILQAPYGLENYRRDKNEPFSDSKNVAAFLEKNYDKSKILVGWQPTSCLSVLLYLPDRKLFYADGQRFGTYYVFDSAFKKGIWMSPVDYAVKVAHDNFKHKLSEVVFLFNYPIMPQTERYLDLVYKSPESALRWDETFYVYKFKENVK